MSIAERGYFGPSQAMLDLTEKFITRVEEVFNAKGIYVQVARQPNGVAFLAENEVYSLSNDGITAELQFRGFHHG